MDREPFIAEREARWSELDAMLERGRALRRDPVQLRRFAELYRATAADFAIATRALPGDPVLGSLGRRVIAARQLLNGFNRGRPRIGFFLTTGYWRRIRERPQILLVAFLFLMVPWLMASVWATREPARAAGLAGSGAQSVITRDTADFKLSPSEKAETSSAIFTNNIRVAFMAFALGIAGGIGALFLLGYQGVVLGATFGLAIHVGNSGPLFEFVFPHGVLELSCIIVAGAAGMRMGWALVAPGYRTRGDALRAEAAGAVEMVVGTALVLVFCGIVEGSLSTSGIGIGPGIAVGLFLGGGFWTLVFWRGRPVHDPVAAFTKPVEPIALRPRLTDASGSSP